MIAAAIALRCLASSADQLEKFSTSRALWAPNRYVGASFAFQEPLPWSEWQSKQEFPRTSATRGSAARLAGEAAPRSLGAGVLEHPAGSIAMQMQTRKQRAIRRLFVITRRQITGVAAACEFYWCGSGCPGRGRPATIGRAKVRKIVAATTQTRPRAGTHWSTRSLAKAQGVSPATVQRIWDAHGLQYFGRAL